MRRCRPSELRSRPWAPQDPAVGCATQLRGSQALAKKDWPSQSRGASSPRKRPLPQEGVVRRPTRCCRQLGADPSSQEMSRLCRKECFGQLVGLQQEGPGGLSICPSERSDGSLACRGQVICPRLHKQKSLNDGLVSKRCSFRLPTCPPDRFCCGELPVGKQTS